MPSKPLLWVLVILSLLAGDKAAAGVEAENGASGTITRACFQPYPETEQQLIQRHFTQATAVFSGFVRELTLERATILVLRVWKGKLSPEIVMPTGSRDNGDGTITVNSESFTFRKGETYLLFGYGTSLSSKVTSACVPNRRLKDSARQIAILDKIVRGGK